MLLPEATSSTVWALVGTPMGLLALWLVLINVATFAVFGLDKWKSKRSGARRIPERNLLLAAAAGGSVGAFLGMRVWHHKTLHKAFSIGIPLIILIQVFLAGGLFVYWNFFR